MNDPAPGQSMEDILASIKRIITDDGGKERVRPPAPPLDPVDEDVLDLEPARSIAMPTPPSASSPPPSPLPAPEDDLVSQRAREAARQALAGLANLSIDPRAAPNTLDGLVREMLRPMLREWLDANLPELVERIVAREVARLVGR